MIDITQKPSIQRSRLQILEGWVERVDLHNRQLHIRTGSRDKVGISLLIPDHCTIRHQEFDFHLRSLLPCDAIHISYHEEDDGARIAQTIELS